MSSAELKDYNSKGDYAAITPLIFAESGNKFYDTYLECFNKKMKPEFGSKGASDPVWRWPKNFEIEGSLDYFTTLETKFEGCASVCVTPLFFLSKPLSEGQPKLSCTVELIHENTISLHALGIFIFTLGVLLCTNFWTGCMLWSAKRTASNKRGKKNPEAEPVDVFTNRAKKYKSPEKKKD
jgi:hypothetical protein